MARVRVWTGSRWADVQVWTGTQWKPYVDYVYGADVYYEEFYGGLNGWQGSGYSYGAQSHVIQWSTWENSVIYVDQEGAPYGLDGKVFRQWGDTEFEFEVAPGTEIRARCAVWTSTVSGDPAGAGNRELSFYAEFLVDGYVQTSEFPAVQHPVGGTNGWVVYTTTVNYTTPASASKPVKVALKEFYIRFYAGGPAVGSGPLMRLHVAWCQLIGPDGNLLKKKTADAVPNLRAWNGTAWV